MAKSELQTYEDFDPIKYERGGKEAEAIVWTSATLDKAVTAMKKGLPLKANPFIGKNTKLVKPNLVFARTEEEIEDYLKCMDDPIYFASKCYLMTPTGLQPAVLRDYQIEYIKHCQKNRFSILRSCRQAGKCLSMTTNIEISLQKNNFLFDDILRKYYFYINKDRYYITLPLFELQNLFDNSFIWKIKYPIYKLIYFLKKYARKKRTKNR